MPHQGNAVGVASKCVDVQADPLEGELLVKQAKIAFIQRDFGCIRTEGETKDIHAVIDCDDYDVLIFRQAGL